jgi:CheY-like chemotaxis protein
MKSILLVDDSPVVLGALRMYLGPLGCELRVAPSGAAALEEASRRCPDVLISDVNMAGASGFDLCRQIRQREDLRHVGIVLITGRTDAEARREAAQAGADAFLTKPLDPDRLCRIVSELLSDEPSASP